MCKQSKWSKSSSNKVLGKDDGGAGVSEMEFEDLDGIWADWKEAEQHTGERTNQYPNLLQPSKTISNVTDFMKGFLIS